MVALNLLSHFISRKKNAVFVSPNMSFRNVMKESVKRYVKEKKEKIAFDILFKGSSSFYEEPWCSYDWIIVDEAHRLKDKAYMYKGNNQIEDIIKSSKNAIFFVDENQVIRKNDIGTNKNIIAIANKYNKKVMCGPEFTLETQFRCSGADGYINAIDNLLQIKETGNFYLNEDDSYDIRICDSPNEMQALIEEKIKNGHPNSRIVAGFAWEWATKKKNINELAISTPDIVIPEHNWSIHWNYADPNMLWAIRDDGFIQAGCIHTCQGLEFDYCGVIIGRDLLIDDNNNLYADYDNYKDTAGKNGLKNNLPELTRLVKNIYKVLLTRGQKGTYVYICDDKLREYFKKHIK